MVSLQIDDKTNKLLKELLYLHAPHYEPPKGDRFRKMRNTNLIYDALVFYKKNKKVAK